MRLEFLLITPAADEGLRLSVEADWEGNDLVHDLNIPDRFVFAPAPTPNDLPPTGGAPTAFGDASSGFAPEMAPCEETFQSLFVAGEIVVKMKPGADIGPILDEEGEPPDAAELSSDEDRGWYKVSVPEGEELAKCRAYSAHPEVLIVEPNFIRILEPIPTPSGLPIGGGAPGADPAPNALYAIAGVALLVVSAAVVYLGAKPRQYPDNS
ncbi:MAG: hypothetical protein V3S98_07255 [Dehalococcoidia bacterium]